MTIAIFKRICMVLPILGLITVGVCIWNISYPPKSLLDDREDKYSPQGERGYYNYVGLAAGAMAVLLGVAAWFPLPESFPAVFGFCVFLALGAATASAGMALYWHEEESKIYKPLEQIGGQIQSKTQMREKILAASTLADALAELIALIYFFTAGRRSSRIV